MTAAGVGHVPVLEFRGVTKRYGDVLACDGVDLQLNRGEIHGILGENGAGKTTLMRTAVGLTIPDAGSVWIDGKASAIRAPSQATAAGLGMVHQHQSLVDALTAWENVALGERGALDARAIRRRMLEVGEQYGLTIDPDAVVRDLPAGMRQRLEIIKCLSHEPHIVILDEPTSVLTPAESASIFEVLAEGVEREGWAVALVSHKLDEVLTATDRITIMRDGGVIEHMMTADADAASLARAMIGRPVSLRTAAAIGASHRVAVPIETVDSDSVAPVLELTELRLASPDGAIVLDGLSLEVRPGEVVGVVGVEGNGQTALTDVLSSLATLDSGVVRLDAVEIPTGVAGAMHRNGIATIPADRNRSGCIPDMTVAENLMLATIDQYSDRGLIARDAVRARAVELMTEFGIHAPDPDVALGTLSGGNQQRVLLASALSVSPRVLVAHQPTRGLDVGAVEYISGRLRAAADDDGIGVLLLSTDIDEVVALADRVVAIYRGRIVGEMNRENIDIARLGLLIGGAADGELAV